MRGTHLGEQPMKGAPSMRHALTRHLKLGSVRNPDWVTAHFGHR
jgi:hypothetical protein